jgi:hypothetical protein
MTWLWLRTEDLLITIPPIAVNGNKVMEADIDVSNGVIHIIDGVLFRWVSKQHHRPCCCGRDSTLLALVGIAGLGGALAGPGELTLVALSTPLPNFLPPPSPS